MNCAVPTPSAANVCAVVVAYYPDADFEARLLRILPQVSMLVLVDNTPEPITLSEDFRSRWQERLHCIANADNNGIAAALNQGLEYAAHMAYPWTLTLDQDTQIGPEMVLTLFKLSEACQSEPIVIGSNYFDPQTNRTKVPVGSRDDDFLEQKTVITSGSFVNVSMALAIGGFRDDYFIDQVDHEFCLRARAHGYTIFISRKSLMTHSVGRLGGVRLPFLGTLPNHPPLRKYYIARNTIVTVANYWRSEPVWCIKRIVRLILGLFEMALLEAHRLTKARAFFAGIADGFSKRMGSCQRAWLQKEESN